MGAPFQWLYRHAANATSQYGENGLLAAIFDRIGTTNRYCVDVGAADGILFSNVRPLIEQGWSAALFEADELKFARLYENCDNFINQPQEGQAVRLGRYSIAASGPFCLDTLLPKFDAPQAPDLLSIDIDGQDWYIWNGLLNFKPRVVVIEFEPSADDEFIPAEGGLGQAGLRAIYMIGLAKGYVAVARTTTNLIFVQRELAGLLEQEGDVDPETGKDALVKIKAVMSVPRYGSMASRGIIDAGLRPFGIPLETSQGVFWDQCLQKHFEDAQRQGMDWVLTLDFDSTFTATQLDEMFHIFGTHPEIDSLVALQARRGKNEPLCTVKGVTEREIDGEPFQVTTAHFGLTLFRMDALRKLDKPWFYGMPNIYGVWGEGKASEDDKPIPWLVDAWNAVGLPDSDPTCELDPDIWFWHQWRRAGNTVFMTPQVRIGHGEELLRIYDEHMETKVITVQEWRDEHKPKEKLRTQNAGGSI